MSFGKAYFLKNHILTVHEGQKQEQQSNALMPDINKLHKCKSSGKSLNRFTCNLCKKSFIRAAYLKDHINSVHKGIKIEKDHDEKKDCFKCTCFNFELLVKLKHIIKILPYLC